MIEYEETTSESKQAVFHKKTFAVRDMATGMWDSGKVRYTYVSGTKPTLCDIKWEKKLTKTWKRLSDLKLHLNRITLVRSTWEVVEILFVESDCFSVASIIKDRSRIV